MAKEPFQKKIRTERTTGSEEAALLRAVLAHADLAVGEFEAERGPLPDIGRGVDRPALLIAHEGEAARLVDAARRHQHVIGPQRKLPIAKVARPRDASVH